jgi:hypothetical protein
MEHPTCSPDLAPNDMWLFPKINSPFRWRFQDIEDIKKCDDDTESYSTTGVAKILPRVEVSLDKVLKEGSTCKVTPLSKLWVYR